MAGQAEVQVSHFLDEYGVGSFHYKLLFWTVLMALIDGYDIGAVAFAAPSLIREWHIAPKALGLLLSASNFGVLFGSQIFGWIGDRYGRKNALILANVLFGIFTFIAAYSTNLTEMSWLRFIAGLGIGGVIPNIVAINAESAPRDKRATLAIIATGMVPLGGACAGFVSAGFVPQVMAGRFYFSSAASRRSCSRWARSSICRNRSSSWPCMKASAARWRRCSRRCVPILSCRRMRASSSRTRSSRRANPLNLFREGLALITPLTWLIFACNLMGYFFLLSWTPTLMGAAHVPPQIAALAGAALQVGGTVGSLLLCSWLQRSRFLAIAIMFVIAVPIVARSAMRD